MIRLLLPTLGYLAFIVYGSLLPFELREMDIHAALETFRAMPHFALGLSQRQDLIANGILYFPLALMLSATATVGQRVSLRVLAASLALLIAVAVATGVEFAQIFFGGRSVSLNDLVSEASGSLLGCLTWVVAGGWLQRGWLALTRQRLAPGTALCAYLAAYLAASLLPMDFLVSLAELKWKYSVAPPAYLLDFSACSSVLHCVLKLPVTVVITLPIGLLFGLLRRALPYRAALLEAIVWAFLLGLTIEAAQFATVSGRAEGGPVLARVLAIVAGVMFVRSPLAKHWSTAVRRHARSVVVLLTPIYAVLLMVVNRWALHAPLVPQVVWQKLETTRFLPFYYHYYSPESAAFVSLLSAIAMYAPIGGLLWLWRYAKQDRVADADFKAGFVIATLAATLVWAGRMMFENQPFADPTNIYIAGAIAALSLWALDAINALGMARRQPADLVLPQHNALAPAGSSWTMPASGWLAAAMLLAILLTHPLPLLMGGLCVVYTFVLIIYPPFWLIAVPCAVPLLDLGELTGWTLINELDVLILNTVAVLAIRAPARLTFPPVAINPWVKMILLALTLSYLVSLARGFMPLVAFDHNALGDYLNPWNALRVASGFLCALLLLPFLRQATARDPRTIDRIMLGALLGLFGTGLIVLQERYLFPGAFDTSSDFRVAGPFTSMAIGGQHIDTYLAASMPLAAWFFVRRYGVVLRGLALAALVLGFYVVIATYTRWSYLAVPVIFGIFIATWMVSVRDHRYVGKLFLAAALGIPMLAALFAMSLTETNFSTRLSATSRDAMTRVDHWYEALMLARQDLLTEVFGEGLGTYPRWRWIWSGEDSRSARVLYSADDGQSYVRLVGGRHLYLDQRVTLNARGHYRLEIEARSSSAQQNLQVLLCEKTVMYSMECVETQIRLASGPAWQRSVADIDIKNVGDDLAYLQRVGRRPVFLTLVSPLAGDSVDVAAVSLRSPSNVELLKNRRFEQGPAHWRIASDDHIAWHTKNLAMDLLFEQGWFGLLAFAALSLRALYVLVVAARAGRTDSAPLLASIAGILFIGMTESLLDTQQLAFFFYLCVFYVIGCLPSPTSGRR